MVIADVIPFVAEVEVAMTAAPVIVCPIGPIERTPVFAIVRPEPITDCPEVTLIPFPDDIVPVATVPISEGVSFEVQYARFPTTGTVDVPTLLLKVDQFADERQPSCEPEAVWQPAAPAE